MSKAPRFIQSETGKWELLKHSVKIYMKNPTTDKN